MNAQPKKVCIIIFTFLAIACSGRSSGAEQRYGGELVVTFGVGMPRHFNPAVASGSAVTMTGTQIFAGLLRYDDNWNPIPYLARTWKVSEDGRSVTLNLTKGATFHDGRPITAADVAFSIMSAKQFHPFKPMFAPVKKVETPDPHTAVIRLAHPHPAILLAMSPALLPILPKHIYGDGQDLKTHPANLAPIGSGAFKFVHYEKGKYLILEKNERYFMPGRPYLDRIIFRIENNVNAQMIDMERQEAHLLPTFFNPDGIDRLRKAEHLAVTPKGYEGVGPSNCLYFNLLRKPLDDKRVRQAIAYAVDKDFITQYLHKGYSIKATGPIVPGSPLYEPHVNTYPTDLDKAGRLLDEAGYALKSDGYRFSLTLDHYPIAPSMHRDVALYLKKQLALIGIKIEVRKSKNMMEWMNRVRNWNFDMTLDILFNWGDPVIGVHRIYSSKNIRKGVMWANSQNYRNATVDDLLEKAALEMDLDQRMSYYSEFQKIVAEDVPVIWPNLIPAHTVYHKNLRNPPLSIWGVHSPLDELYWENPPVISYAPTPPVNGDSSQIKRVGVRAISIIKEKGFYQALEIFQDPDRGFLDLQGSGLHIIGFTEKGIVFIDNSGQMKRGMNISGILDLDEKRLLPQLLEAAQGKNGGHFSSIGLWPHPSTHEVGLMSSWCGMLTDRDAICVLSWSQKEGE